MRASAKHVYYAGMRPPRYVYVAHASAERPREWWLHDAETGRQVAGAFRTRFDTYEHAEHAGWLALTNAGLAALPTYVQMRTRGEATLLPAAEHLIPALRTIAAAEHLRLVTRHVNPRSTVRRSVVVSVIYPESNLVATYRPYVETIETVGDLL